MLVNIATAATENPTNIAKTFTSKDTKAVTNKDSSALPAGSILSVDAMKIIEAIMGIPNS